MSHDIDTAYHTVIDNVERVMLAFMQPVEQPVEHLFLPGLYVRKIFNPAGSLIVTKIHKTEHPFFLLAGCMSIRNVDGEVIHIEAPHWGVTKPGTRRVIFAHTDVTFVTVHPNPDNTHNLDEIENRLIERRELIPGKSSYELFQQRLLETAEGAQGLMAAINPAARNLPVDRDGIRQAAFRLASGDMTIDHDIIEEAREHMNMLGVSMVGESK